MSEKKKVSAYQKLIEGINDVIDTGKYKDFLKSMKRFHHYSFSNRLLIYSQNPEATKVAGYKTWRELGRGVKSNPKRIFIICPIFVNKKNKKENDKPKKQVEETNDEDDNYIYYKWSIVYDINDTYIIDEEKAKGLMDDLRLNTSTSEDLYNTLLKISPVKIENELIYSGARGYYSKKYNKIVIDQKETGDDKTSVLLHEMTHAMYDDFDYSKDRDLSEIFVESTAFVVADYFGLDTGKKSFIYVTNWSKEDAKKVLKLGEKIQKASDDFINKIETELYSNENERVA